MLLSISEIESRAAALASLPKRDALSAIPPLRADQLALQEPRTPEVVKALEEAHAAGRGAFRVEITNICDAAEFGHFTPTPSDWAHLLISARAVSDWQTMVNICTLANTVAQRDGSEPLTATPAFAQQYAMALNRLGDSWLAESVIAQSIGRHGADSESQGILGRIYKDRWLNDHRGDGAASGFLVMALNAYWGGVERNALEIYPAINTLTLLRCAGLPSHRLERFAEHIFDLATQRTMSPEADYFDFATVVELHAAMDQIDAATQSATEAVKHARAPWELETTASNLMLLEYAADSRYAELTSLIDMLKAAATNWLQGFPLSVRNAGNVWADPGFNMPGAVGAAETD
jgi:hypothetical protein